MPALLMTLSILTCLVAGWMTSMFLILRHPHYLERASMGGVILLGAVVVAAGGWRGPRPIRAAVGVWAVALLALGTWALLGDSGDDGWVLIAGLLFAAEGSAAAFGALRGASIA
jgi:hypothetical protein